MRSGFAIAAAALALGLLPAAAVAQTQKGSYPWETKADRFYQRGSDLPSYNPNAETDRALEKLGLKPNKPIKASGGAASAGEAAGTRLLHRYDTNHDGSISQSEYLAGKVPSGRIGSAGFARTEVARSRSRTRFEAADRNRDGKLSPKELNDIRDPRF